MPRDNNLLGLISNYASDSGTTSLPFPLLAADVSAPLWVSCFVSKYISIVVVITQPWPRKQSEMSQVRL